KEKSEKYLETEGKSKEFSRVIKQKSTRKDAEARVYYGVVTHEDRTVDEIRISANGVSVPIRGATYKELKNIKEALKFIPCKHLEKLIQKRNGIVVTDWTGSGPHNESSKYHRLSGGSNISRTIERRSSVEKGSRIEITHTALEDSDGGVDTVLHEIGHTILRAGLIPRSGGRSSGSVSHNSGGSEEPTADAYANYFLGRKMSKQDREAFRKVIEKKENQECK
ncbi:MAG: hypothetical protein AAFR59_17215, partial [Bacteroidota bacterium]